MDEATRKHEEPLFEPGKLVMTVGALAALADAGADPMSYVVRHLRGDWGDLSADDKAENEFSIAHDLRILSAYHLPSGTKIWVITEADRSSTAILLPEEY